MNGWLVILLVIGAAWVLCGYLWHDQALRVWLNTPPDEEDFFFVHLRQMYQAVFPCRHEWVYPAAYKRHCRWCGRYEAYCYYRFGAERFGWKRLL